MIGRDLVRLLQNIAKIQEIEAFWRDLIHNPTSLSSGFTGKEKLIVILIAKAADILCRIYPFFTL